MCIRDSPETALPLQPPSAYEANRDIVFMTLPLLALSTYFYGARPAVLCLTCLLYTSSTGTSFDWCSAMWSRT